MANEIDYRELFKKLLKAYYENVFEEVVEKIISNKDIKKESLSKIISALCGVEIDFSKDFSNDLKKAIENYKESNKVVINTHSCIKDCVVIDGKTICQNACPFGAIIMDNDQYQVQLNMDTCVGCGLCIEQCDNKNFVDKVEFIPLINTLRENKKVIAAVAPAIVGQFGEDVSMGQIGLD